MDPGNRLGLPEQWGGLGSPSVLPLIFAGLFWKMGGWGGALLGAPLSCPAGSILGMRGEIPLRKPGRSPMLPIGMSLVTPAGPLGTTGPATHSHPSPDRNLRGLHSTALAGSP